MMKNQMNGTVDITLTREETLLLEIVIGDEKKRCLQLYGTFLEESSKENGLTYPKNAEDSFLRILGRLDTIKEKLK